MSQCVCKCCTAAFSVDLWIHFSSSLLSFRLLTCLFVCISFTKSFLCACETKSAAPQRTTCCGGMQVAASDNAISHVCKHKQTVNSYVTLPSLPKFPCLWKALLQTLQIFLDLIQKFPWLPAPSRKDKSDKPNNDITQSHWQKGHRLVSWDFPLHLCVTPHWKLATHFSLSFTVITSSISLISCVVWGEVSITSSSLSRSSALILFVCANPRARSNTSCRATRFDL